MSDDLPAGDMKYSFKSHVQAHGFAGDRIISSTTVKDLVTSTKLIERAGIMPTTRAQQAATTGNGGAIDTSLRRGNRSVSESTLDLGHKVGHQDVER